MATLKIINNTPADVFISDVGIVIPASGEDTITDKGLVRKLAVSEHLRALVTALTLKLNDGSVDIPPADADGFLLNYFLTGTSDSPIKIPTLSHNTIADRNVFPAHPEQAVENFVALVNANTTLDATHGTVLVDTFNGPVTITLPTAVGISGRIYKIKKVSSDMNIVRISCSGYETIDGADFFALSGENNFAAVQSDGTNWRVISSVFGNDYQTEISAARSTTNSLTFQDKTKLTTPILRGTYRVNWHAIMDANSANVIVEARLYDETDGVVIGAQQEKRASAANLLEPVGGFAEIVFVGKTKTLKIQWRSQGGWAMAGIQDARIELWRVK